MRHFLDHPRRRVLVGAPQPGHQQISAAEHVERQIAVAIVIAVIEPPFLLAVQRIVRRVEIENDFLGCAIMRLQEHIDQQIPDRRRIVADLVIARRLQPAQFETIECRLAGHRRTILAPRRKLAGQHRHHGIVAQLVMVIEILVTLRNGENPLAHQCRDLMLDQFLPPLVVKARGKSFRQPDRSIRRTQQQRSRVRRHQAGIKRRFHRAAFYHSKFNAFRATFCRHRGAPRIIRKLLWHNYFR